MSAIAKIPRTAEVYTKRETDLAIQQSVKPIKRDVESLLFAKYYPEGNVKSAAEFTQGIKYNFDTANHTATVKSFTNTGNSENDNSGLVGRVVIPPFVDAGGNGYITDDGTRLKVVGVSKGAPEYFNRNLTAIITPTTVTSVNNFAFGSCPSLTSVSFPTVTSIGPEAFSGCTSLVSVSLPSTTSIDGGVFQGCTSLASVHLPAMTSTGDGAFYNCTSLASINFGATPRASVPTLGNDAFIGVPSSCKIIVPDAQYNAWTAETLPDEFPNPWHDLVTAGYRFLKHSEWEYARKYELDGKLDKSGGTVMGDLEVVNDSYGFTVKNTSGDYLQIRHGTVAGNFWYVNYSVANVGSGSLRLPYDNIIPANVCSLAGWFNESTTYAWNSLCTDFQGVLYRCVNPNGHTGAWVAADFAVANVEDVLAVLRTGKLDSTSAAPAFSSDSSVQYAIGSHVTYNGKLYRCTTATTGGAWTGSANWTAEPMTDTLRYDCITITTGQLQDHATQKVTLNAATTTLTLPALTNLTDKVSDFGIDMVNGYAPEVGGTPTPAAASFQLDGVLGTDYNLIVPDGETWSEMTKLAPNEMAVYYFTLSAFWINDKPTWEVMKKVVTLVPVPPAP